MKRYVLKGGAFIAVGGLTFAVLVVLAITNIWDVSKVGSFVLPMATGLAAAIGVANK